MDVLLIGCELTGVPESGTWTLRPRLGKGWQAGADVGSPPSLLQPALLICVYLGWATQTFLHLVVSYMTIEAALCQQADSALHILSGCQHTIISSMITERNNVACRLIIKAISKGSLAGCLVHLDASSSTCLAQQNLQIPAHAYKKTIPSWLFNAHLSARDRLTSSRPHAILVTPLPTKDSNIQPIGRCKVWIREINQIAQVKLARTEAHRSDTEIHTSPTNYASLPQFSDATRACMTPLMENVLVC